MNDKNKTKEELLTELAGLRERLSVLEASERQCRLAEGALEERKNFLKNILSSIQDGISILDKDLNIVFVNPAMEKWYAHKMPLAGKKCYDAYHDRKEPCVVCPSIRTLNGGTKDFEIVPFIGEDGIKGWQELYTFPFLDSKTGQLSGVIEYVRNITKRKQAEEALILAEAKFRSLNEQSLVGIYIIQDEKFIYVNPKAGEIFGYIPEEVLSLSSIYDVVSEADRPVVKENIRSRIDGETPNLRYIFKGLRKDGVFIDAEVHGARTQYGGKPAIVGVVLDITERKRLEAEIQKTEKLELLGLLAGGIAHDFNNFLTAIIGNVSLAKMYTKPGYEAFDILTEAEKASSRASDLTQQLMTFSRGGTPVKKLISVREMIEDCLSFTLSGSNIGYEVLIPDKIMPIEADESQMSQVINNLVINAKQAMPNGGLIQVSAENIALVAGKKLPVKDGEYVKVAIKDNGIGISEENLAKIFDPFFTTKETGTGLGLASSQSIIQKHGGHIMAESKTGAGTTFYLYLPASREKLPVRKTAKDVSIGGRGRVLVVDDEELVRVVVSRMLVQCGYEPALAEEGAEAVELYKDSKDKGLPFAAVIIDLVIKGGLGGKETIMKLMEIDPAVRAVLSSGYAEDPVMTNYKDYGFKGVLPKPFETAELSRVLSQVLAGNKH